jgi:hypothetical protein
MNKKFKRLRLSSETLRTLVGKDLAEAAGGTAATDNTIRCTFCTRQCTLCTAVCTYCGGTCDTIG